MRRLRLKSIGDVCLPGRFDDAEANNAPLKLFGPGDLSQLNGIFSHLRRGGIAVASGSWDSILEVLNYLERRKRELATVGARHAVPRAEAGHHNPRHRQQANRWYERHYQRTLSRLMVIAQDDRLPYIDPPVDSEQAGSMFYIPYLLELLGEMSGSNDELPFLVPMTAIQKIQSDMEQSYYMAALEGSMVAHSNVLPPLSNDTIELFLEGLRRIVQAPSLFGRAEKSASPTVEVLDMGCGCGCLSLLAAKVFTDCHVKVLATDILPEAIATTKLNIQRFVEAKTLPSGAVDTTSGGDLFEPIGGRRFDLIIFNAPWVVSRPRSRAEMATCDADQNTVRRFLTESQQHLKKEGHVILGYSDHSGPGTVENLEDMVGKAGLKMESVLKRRTQSRSKGRKWETILVYDLAGES